MEEKMGRAVEPKLSYDTFRIFLVALKRSEQPFYARVEVLDWDKQVLGVLDARLERHYKIRIGNNE